MSPDFIRNTVARRPFRSFILHLAGGRSIPVRSPEFIDLPAEGRLVIVDNPNGSTHVIDFPHAPIV